jgi:hypothetical protein
VRIESEGLGWVVVLGQKCLKMAVDIRVCKIDFYVLFVFWELCFMFVATEQNLMSDIAIRGFTFCAVRFGYYALRATNASIRQE